LVTTSPRECVSNLDELPFEDGDLCHYSHLLDRVPELFLLSSRSCPYQCTFCYHLKGSYYRTKSLDYLFKELDYHLARYGDKIKRLTILDDLFGIDKIELLEFCRRIKPYGLQFLIQTRIDCIDEECIIKLKDAGAYLLSYGLESASNKVLVSMKKQYTIEQAESVLALTNKHGLKIQANLIIGDIEDDLDSVHESETFYQKYGYKYDLNIDFIRVFPGTQLYKYAINKGIIKDELAFLEAGCPFINVSKIPDYMYSLLMDKYTNGYSRARSMVTRRPLFNKRLHLSLDNNGIVSFTCYCPNCYSVEMINGINLFENIRDPYQKEVFFRCSQCSQRLRFGLARPFASNQADIYLIRNLAEAFFKKYTGSRVVIWGIKDEIRRLLFVCQTLRDIIVKLVDSNYENYALETYCGLSVEHPDSLKGFSFDYVLTITTELHHEITETLASIGIIPEFINPIFVAT
jgi:RNase P subunit RPR2